MRTPPRRSAPSVALLDVFAVFAVFAILAPLVASGCVGSAVPRLPVSVAAAITDAPMRRLESDALVLYYPAARRDEAVRFLAHVDACVGALRARAVGRSAMSHAKVVLILPELPYNNAFVGGRAEGYEEIGVIPTLFTSDVFSLENGIPPDPAAIACHEVTHFVHLQQIEGFSRVWNLIFGQAYTPQLGLDAWFDEGLAVYYETLLQRGVGRLAWPYWQGVFAAGVAGRRLTGGDLSAYDRDYVGGNHYLVGSQFVQFLADRYGEAKLWKLINVQARSVFFPFGVNLRFWQAYRKSLSTLIDEFAADVAARTPVVARPPEQRVIRDAGWSARYARARDGTEALLVSSRDEPTRLRVFAPDGRTLVDRDLTDVLPPRKLVTSAPSVSGGLSFTADGRTLYFVAVDQDPTYLASRLVRFDLRSRTFEVVVRDLGGPGGSVSPDGTRYFFARAGGDHHDLAALDLATGHISILDAQPPGAYVAQPRVSPDGTRLVVTTFDGRGFGLALHDAVTGRRLRALPIGALVAHDASWADDERLVFLGSATRDQGFQVHLYDLRDDSTKPISRAPYLAFAPQAAAGTVRFLNREGWSWTVDEIALPSEEPLAPAPKQARIAPPDAPEAPPPDAPEAPPPDAPEARPPDAPPVLGEASEAPPRDEDAAPPGPTAMPAPAEPRAAPPPAILSDEPASSFERLFVPQLRGPVFGATSAGDAVYGLSVTGADRLERQRWVLTGLYESVVHTPSLTFAYSNRMLAPLTLTLSASQVTQRREDYVRLGGNAVSPFYYRERDRVGRLAATRSFYGNPVSAGLMLDERAFPGGASPAGTRADTQRLGGGFVSATYEGLESTPYTGIRRLVYAAARVRLFPEAWGTLDTSLVDLRGEVELRTPLPLLRRHTLTLNVVARDLAYSGARFPFLQVGGLPSSVVAHAPDRAPLDPELDPRLPYTFSESLRGFEDRPFGTDAVILVDASYRYPFIIDGGWASTLWILPSLFVRQIDLELFGAAAQSQGSELGADRNAGNRHEAAGGSLTLSTVFGPAPLSLTCQVARRLTDDRGASLLFLLSN